MNARSIALALVAAGSSISSAAQEVSREPSWDEFRQIAEAAVTARLIDPDSARISWTSGIHRGEFKPLLEKRVYGYIACGLVNARNRMGGYTGNRGFAVVVNFGEAIHVTIDTIERGSIAKDCVKAIDRGLFPRAPDNGAALAGAGRSTSSAQATSVQSSPTKSGLIVRPMPEGAYIASVTPGSSAATAGLTPGMVITTVNGIPLAGMGDAMSKVLEVANDGASFALIGGKTVRLPTGP